MCKNKHTNKPEFSFLYMLTMLFMCTCMYRCIGIYVYNMRQAFEIGKKMFAKYLQMNKQKQSIVSFPSMVTDFYIYNVFL